MECLSIMPVFDSHAHAFPDHLAGPALKKLVAEALWMPVRTYHDGTVAGLLAGMDRAGIDRVILCSIATRPQQVRKITDWSATIASPRVVPFASIHPDFDAPEAEAQRIADLGIRGLKFHSHYMGCAVDDPRALRIARAAAAAGLVMEFHAGYDLAFPKDQLASPRQFRRLHEAVPELTFVACHMGGWQRWDEVLEHTAGLPIYIETSFSLGQCPQEKLLKIIERHPPQYLLFGTDAPWADQAAELAAFRALPISDALKRLALWDNALRFIGES
jgi:predicted TIM-barrel fold metal-dependent hydrolase